MKYAFFLIATLALFAIGMPTQAQDKPAPREPAKKELKKKLIDKVDKLKESVLGNGTRFATPIYQIDSGNPGPTLFLTGGVHGDEAAGAYAAEQIRHWNLFTGKLIVIPRTNVPGLEAKSRFITKVEKDERDLNRNFGEKPKGDLAKLVWDLVKKHKPDWLVDLHEGTDFNVKNKKSVGSSVIAANEPSVAVAAGKMISAVNECLISKDVPFQQLKNPVKGSLARSAFTELKVKSMICETTIKGQALPFRARQHRVLVHSLFDHLGMVGADVTPNTMTHRDPKVRSFALYDSSGSAGRGVPNVEKQLTSVKKGQVIRVCAKDIQEAALMPFESVIFTGGSGSGQAKSLEELGRKKVASFVREGGGYIGICAGAYLACSGFSWGLGILDAKTKKGDWRRGKATLRMSCSVKGTKGLKLKKECDILYANGPILTPHGQADIPDYEVLATFKTEVAKNKSRKGIQVGSPAMATGTYGKGRVLVSSPHPEQTKGMEDWIVQAVGFVAKK